MIKLLVENGANVNSLSSEAETPLHLAATNGHLEMVKLLVEKGADVNSVDRYGNMPLHMATMRTNFAIYIMYGWDCIYNTDNICKENKHEETARFLIKNGANTSAINRIEFSPLHYAVLSGLLEIVKLLLRMGKVNINSVADDKFERRGFTSLDFLILFDITSRYDSIRHYSEAFFTLLIFGANLTEKCIEIINESDHLRNCLAAFEKIKEVSHLGKIIQGYKERNLEVILDYISKYGKENNIEQLIQELQSIKGCYSSNESRSFIPETLLDIVKYMVQQYLSQHRKIQFKIGALSGLICQAIHSELKKEVSLEDIVSPKVASILSDQDAVNLSLVCKSINYKANDRTGINQHAKNMLLT